MPGKRGSKSGAAPLDSVAADFGRRVVARSDELPWPVLGLFATGSEVLKNALSELLRRKRLERSANPFAPLAGREDDLRRTFEFLLAHLVIMFFSAVDKGENREQFGEFLDCDPDEAEEVVLGELAAFQDDIAEELSAELLEVWDEGDPARYSEIVFKNALVAGGITDRLDAPAADVRFVLKGLQAAARALEDGFWEATAALQADDDDANDEEGDEDSTDDIFVRAGGLLAALAAQSDEVLDQDALLTATCLLEAASAASALADQGDARGKSIEDRLTKMQADADLTAAGRAVSGMAWYFALLFVGPSMDRIDRDAWLQAVALGLAPTEETAELLEWDEATKLYDLKEAEANDKFSIAFSRWVGRHVGMRKGATPEITSAMLLQAALTSRVRSFKSGLRKVGLLK